MTVVFSAGTQSELDARVDEEITKARLRRDDNRFLLRARSVESVEPVDALSIALQFRAMTKMFMFSTISGLGVMAQSFLAQDAPDRELLAVFQTAYRVMDDDLNNVAPEFCTVAPAGSAGVHYLWWEDTVLNPVAAHVDESGKQAAAIFPQPVLDLLANMKRLASHPLGAAVQLRVVETIAMEVAVAFRRMFSKVRSDGRSIFTSTGDLAFMDSHIKAEVNHAKQVSDGETGMSGVVTTEAEGDQFVELIKEYSINWSRSIENFVDYLDKPGAGYLNKPSYVAAGTRGSSAKGEET